MARDCILWDRQDSHLLTQSQTQHKTTPNTLIYKNTIANNMGKLLFSAMLFMASVSSAVATYPMTLLMAGFEDAVRFDEPRVVGSVAPNGTVICLFQQGDGNFRVLRSASHDDCSNNLGDLIYHSGFSLPYDISDTYYTKLQVDGNLITRKETSNDWVWKSHSGQGDIDENFRLVLNADDTLSILDENEGTIWNSVTHETRTYKRPLVLMRSWPDRKSRAWFNRPLKVFDRLANTYVCIFQQGDGNFRVLRGDACNENKGSVIFRSGFSATRPHNEKYYTHLQRDGNLVTRSETTEMWTWTTCSSQGNGVEEYFNLVLTGSDTLAILDINGTEIWESAHDESCFA